MNHTLESVFICRNEDFQQWVQKRLQGCWGKIDEPMAANFIREFCHIGSRSELKTNEQARIRFETILDEFCRDRAKGLAA